MTENVEGPSERPIFKGPSGLLLLAVWFGLSTGLAETGVPIIKALAKNGPLLPNINSIWMIPFSDFLIFVSLGLLILPVSLLWSKVVTLRVLSFVFALVGFLSVLLSVGVLRGYAATLLAAGLALQSANVIAKHADGFHRLVRRTIVIMLAVVFVAAAGAFGWREISEQRALAKLPAAPAEAPNVLLIVLDTVRAQNLSLYGYARSTTPRLERLAASSAVFERAISTAPWTLPSHSSMFTGRMPSELSSGWNKPLDGTYPVIAEALGDRGYQTAGFVGNIGYCGRARGLARGFARYEVRPLSVGQVVLSSSIGRLVSNHPLLRRAIDYHQALNHKNAQIVTEDFLQWLGRSERRPFFAFLNYFDAHQPCLPPEPFAVKFGPKRERAFEYESDNVERAEKWKMTPDEIQAEIDAYDGSINYIDHQLGLLLDELSSRGVLENTLVIITSDHGEQFGEHRLFGHGNSVYLPSLHVPLLIRLPSRVPAGIRISNAVSLRDIPSTVVDLIDAEPGRFPGYSLARCWSESTGNGSSEGVVSEVTYDGFAWQDWYPVKAGDLKSLIVEPYHYIRNGDGREELYHFEIDPSEVNNIASTERGRAIVQRFRSSLETSLASNRASE